MTKEEYDAVYYLDHKDEVIRRSVQWNRANSTRRCTARRKTAGNCTQCGKVAIAGKVRCAECANSKAVESKERYRFRLSQGLCPSCKGSIVAGKRACSRCLLQRQIQELRKAGLSESELVKARIAAENFNGLCQACNRKDACGIWCLDHCHETMTFRGVVGRYCNLALGNVCDNPDTLRQLANYLERKLC